jgi:LPXTG-motif cell wall-anchored protein
MKKKGLATGAVAMALAVSMAFMPAIAKAETVDNVDVTVTTDKTEYSSGEEVKLNVNVKNNNAYELKSPNITFQLPDGLTVDGKSTYSYDFNSISSGATTNEVVELKNVTVTDNNSQVTNPTQDSNSNVTVPTQDSNSNVIVSTENNSDDKQAEAKAPQTGDTAKTIIYVITLLLAGIIFIVLKKKKIASSLLVLALIATGLAVIPSSSVKAATNKSVTGKVTVKVDAKDADINYAFTYSVDTVSDDSGSNTDTTQPSGGSSTEVTNRSEIGKKILDFKNPEKVAGVKKIFSGSGLSHYSVTDKYGRTQVKYSRELTNDILN